MRDTAQSLVGVAAKIVGVAIPRAGAVRPAPEMEGTDSGSRLWDGAG